MGPIQSNHGTDKPRGLINAELQRLRHQAKLANDPPMPLQSAEDVYSAFDLNLVATVELTSSKLAQKTTYAPNVDSSSSLSLTNSNISSGKDIFMIGNGVKVNWEDGSGGVDNGSDTIIIGNGAKVNWTGGSGGVENGNDIIIIGNGAKVEITGGVHLDLTKGGMNHLDGKLQIHLKDEANRSFRMEIHLKDKDQSEGFQELLREKMKGKHVQLNELMTLVNDTKKESASKKDPIPSSELSERSARPKNKPFDTINMRMQMMQSLINHLFQHKPNADQGQHKGLRNQLDIKV